ncbi:MAG: hypothetical protein RJA22_3097 [Verrucomicrobiota bacterium]|jgi:hypothetical protein
MKKKLLIASGVLVVVLVAGLIVLGLSLGKVIKHGVETVAPPLTKTDVKLGSASLSLFNGHGSLHGFVLGNPEGFKTPSAIKAETVSLGVNPASLLSDKIHVTHVRVVGPEITFEGAIGSKNNLSQILANVDAALGGGKPAEPKKDDAAATKLQVDEFSITGAKVSLSMTVLGGKAVTVPLPPIKLENLGQGPDGITPVELVQKALTSITAETLKAAQQAVVDFTKNATGAAVEAGKGAADAAVKSASGVLDAAKGVGDLFKRKEKTPEPAPAPAPK